MSQKKESEINNAILAVVASIKVGETLSYKEVAKRSGYPSNARLVGYLMSKNFNKNIPCHRVIRTDGEVGEYNKGKACKISLLRSEGINIFCRSNGRCVVQ